MEMLCDSLKQFDNPQVCDGLKVFKKENMEFDDPKHFDDPQASDDPKGISIGSMYFDNPKVYGDTSITDRLVYCFNHTWSGLHRQHLHI